MEENKNLIAKRLIRTKQIGRLLVCLPAVSCVILNGSLAGGNHKQSSDIDILIIAKDGRIFTARFFVNFFAILIGIKRSKNEHQICDNQCKRSVSVRSKDESKSHAGKFCFNYFLTEGYLEIPTGRGENMDRYCAQNYSKSLFIAGNKLLFEKFINENIKLFEKYDCEVSNTLPDVISTPWPCSRVEKSSNKRSLHFGRDDKRRGRDDEKNGDRNDTKKIAELLPGNCLEKLVKNYQIKKIESDPRTKKYPKLIVYNDRELRFHPPRVRDK